MPWEPPEDPDDSALLFRVESEIKLPEGAYLSDYRLMIRRSGDSMFQVVDQNYKKQSEFPNDPLLIKLKPGTWQLYQAAFTVDFGEDYAEEIIRTHIDEPAGYELKKGEVAVGEAIRFTAEVIPKPNSNNFTWKTRFKRSYGQDIKRDLINAALKAAPEDSPWHAKLVAARERLEAKP